MGFGDEVKAFAKKAPKKARFTIIAIQYELFSSVILDTPVLTGRLRGNWQTTQNHHATGVLAVEDKSGGKAINRIRDNLPDGDGVSYLTNNLPYSVPIEFDGYSGKAPEGMVRRNVARIQSIIRKANR